MPLLISGKTAIRPSRKMKDREGVASVVGTILALLVFLSILGIFTNHYVPSMMAGNEHNHDSQVITQISELKQDIDNMMLYYLNSHSNTLSSYTPLTLGSSGVPMFATGTQGQLGIIPVAGKQDPSMSVLFNYTLNGNTFRENSLSGGGVVVNIPNRYYIPQSVLYQNDAVLLGQSGGQVMLANPGFNVTSSGSAVSISLLQLSIETPTSSNITFSGTNTVGLTSQLLEFSQQTYSVTGPIKIQIITPFATAWENFINSTFRQAGLSQGNGLTVSVSELSFQNYILTVAVTPNAVHSEFQITLSTAIVSIAAEE
ncbi:MAG: hypothetical protein J9259_08375 [Thermoplasmata archaeon YP2-bin.285]|nr:hypothetical protein [Candidatus Sysuiplasma superficiale]